MKNRGHGTDDVSENENENQEDIIHPFHKAGDRMNRSKPIFSKKSSWDDTSISGRREELKKEMDNIRENTPIKMDTPKNVKRQF